MRSYRNESDADILGRLEYLGLDDMSCAALRRVAPLLTAAIPGILDHFYDHNRRFAEIAPMLRGDGKVEMLKRAQVGHWQRMLSGNYDAGYQQAVDAVARAHQRIGLSPRWYVGGYAFILRQLLRVVEEGVHDAAEARLAREAVVMAVMLDTELVISAYFDGMTEQRMAEVEAMVIGIESESRDSVESVEHFTTFLTDSVGTLNQNRNAMIGSAHAAAQASSDILEASESVAGAADELRQSITEISRQVSVSARQAARSVEEADTAKAVVSDLDRSAAEIGDILALITNIARETNLLALNATIEAARAGEAGKGFAVVASEVKGLAGQSERAARDIKDRVTRIQTSVRAAVEAIGRVVAAIHEVEGNSQAVAAAVVEQTSATSGIADNVAQVAHKAREVRDRMGEVEGAINESARATETVESSAVRLKDALGTLPQLLSRAIRTVSDIADRRAHRRRPVYIDAQVAFGERILNVVMRDLSENGAFVDDAVNGNVEGVDRGAQGLLKFQGHTQPCRVVATAQGLNLEFTGTPMAGAVVNQLAVDSTRHLVDLAKNDHRAWVANVVDGLEGRKQLRAADLSTHHSCRLGRWYDTIDDKMTLELKAYREMAEPHRRVHTAGREALHAQGRGDHQQATEWRRELEAASGEVIAMLDRFNDEFVAVMKG
jgi:methyl-accepting chemotaxis protein